MKRIINSILFLFAAIAITAQNSFVVADKNGKSQFVQGLIFQQQNADHFTWKSNGSASGDIKDLLFVARAQAQLATASSNDVIEMLEELSGTDVADAEGIAAALQNNPNVEEAYTADGANLVVTTSSSGYHVVYPMYDACSPFVDDDIEANLSKLLQIPKHVQPRKSSGANGKIAIFNYYDGFGNWYRTQNGIAKAIEKMFDDNDYHVDYYGDGSNGLLFTEGNLKNVVGKSSEYKAIIILGHGGARWTDVNDYNNQYPDVAKKKRNVIATKEQCFMASGANSNDEYIFHDKYYYMMDCELEVTGNCILYDGTCCSAPTSGFSTEDGVYPNVSKSIVLGWNGMNRMSQAHAALLFYRMLYEGWSLKDAITLTFQQDTSYGSFYLVKDSYDQEADRYDRDYSKLLYSKYVGTQKLQGKSDLKKNFFSSASVYFDDPGDQTIKKSSNVDNVLLSGQLYGNFGQYPYMHIKLNPIYGNNNKAVYKYTYASQYSDGTRFEVYVPLVSEGIYDVEIWVQEPVSEQWVLINPGAAPKAYIYSGYFRQNCAIPAVDDEKTRTPLIVNENDEAVNEITLPAGTSKTFEVDAYSGHELKTLSLNTNVATVSLNGTTLTVTGVSEGSTLIGVCDRQNRQMAAVRVTVTAGGTSEPIKNETFTVNGVSFTMVGVEGGTFWMGAASDDGDAYILERPRHQVKLGSFAIGQTEVTQALWEAVMGSNPSYYKGSNLPVEQVSWDDCQEFISKLNALTGHTFRLPAEAEWEYAARGGKYSHGYKYAGGDDIDAVAWYSGNSNETTHPVGTKAANELGLYDMSGNVHEWCLDWYVNYPGGVLNSTYYHRVCRGGSLWWDGSGCRVAFRFSDTPGNRIDDTGLRLALSGSGDFISCPDDHHPHLIDLGLPSGTKWACCNVGATKPEDYGGYYAWGETKEKDYYHWDTYLYGTYNYDYDYSNLVDIGADIAGTNYDVAYVKWGGLWKMPSTWENQELIENCKSEWIYYHGVSGRKFIGLNGNVIFLPAAGKKYNDDEYLYQGINGFYWSSDYIDNIKFDEMGFRRSNDTGDLYEGHSVRPVRKN